MQLRFGLRPPDSQRCIRLKIALRYTGVWGTAIRTVAVLILSWLVVSLIGSQSAITGVSGFHCKMGTAFI